MAMQWKAAGEHAEEIAAAAGSGAAFPRYQLALKKAHQQIECISDGSDDENAEDHGGRLKEL
jgi:hypothetical protein